MVTSKGWARRLCAIASIVLASAYASAFLPDEAKILIDRTLSSPTITVRYSGANAAIAELRINGVSYGTRNLNSGKNSGETNFTIDLNALRAGDNELVINLFNKAGKLIGTQRQAVATEASDDAPVFIKAPKVGATVQGPVEIKVGFGKDLKNSYVSFFIDNQFRSMSNLAPYSFLWDTEREINGWHDLEAWVVDENNQTLKAHKVRVFVNNPGGATTRKVNKKQTDVTLPPTGDKTTAEPTKNSSSVGGTTLNNDIRPPLGNLSGTKAPPVDDTVPTGAKLLTPTGTRVVKAVTPKKAVSKPPVASKGAGLVKVNKGTRLPELGNFSIVLNNKFVDFDVQPRVEGGVPLTPFRHLMEQAGGEVKWKHETKSVDATGAGQNIFLRIGDIVAKINNSPVSLEQAPFIEKGRTIVPLSFIKEALKVDVEYDKATGHVLITHAKKN
jgi:hypothetical protein